MFCAVLIANWGFVLMVILSIKQVFSTRSEPKLSAQYFDSSRKLSSTHINRHLNQPYQDDPFLIEVLRNQYLHLPSDLPYNFTNEHVDLEGQSGQPSYIADSFNWNETNTETRFFVEAGAYDGELISNSLLFEKKLGWSGLLIEPNPVAFEQLLNKHRKAWSINACLSRKPFPEIIEFDMNGISGGIIAKHDLRPGDLQKRNDEFRKTRKMFLNGKGLKHDIGRIDDYLKESIKEDRVQMQCFPLYSILKAIERKTVDYLSLDIEGAEYGVLDAAFCNSDDWKLNVASIERTYLEVPQFGSSNLEMKYLMKRFGYRLHTHIGEDDIFINKKFQMQH